MERSATNSTPATEAMKPSRRHWSYVAAAELAESLKRQFEPPSKDQSREQGQSEDSTDEWMEMLREDNPELSDEELEEISRETQSADPTLTLRNRPLIIDRFLRFPGFRI